MIVAPRTTDPFLDERLTPTQQARTWFNKVTDLQIIDGIGSPECVVKAVENRLYRDTAIPGTIYVKAFDEIGKDETKGWQLVASPALVTVIATNTTSLGVPHQLIICNNTSAITVTLHSLAVGGKVDVARVNTGAVTVDGGGANIIGRSKINLLSRYDVVNIFALDAEWILDS